MVGGGRLWGSGRGGEEARSSCTVGGGESGAEGGVGLGGGEIEVGGGVRRR